MRQPVFEMMRYKNIMGQKGEDTCSFSPDLHPIYPMQSGAYRSIIWNTKKKVKVLVLSEYDFAHPEFLISLYEFHTANNIQYETWDKETLNIVPEIRQRDYDAIITNFDIKEIDTKRIMNMSRLSILQSCQRILIKFLCKIYGYKTS